MQVKFRGQAPHLHPTARVAENATLIGDVTIERDASLWFGAVLRGDLSAIRVGARSNIQDNAVLHSDEAQELTVGSNVSVGHGAILHSCTVEDTCVIGMGAILLNGCVIGAGSMVAAGALVTQNTIIPPGSLVIGSPAKVKRPLTGEEQGELAASASEYISLSAALFPPAGGNAAGVPL